MQEETEHERVSPHAPDILFSAVNCEMHSWQDFRVRKGTKSFHVLTGDQELEVRTATCGPEIDQLQHAKPVSHMITKLINAPFVC